MEKLLKTYRKRLYDLTTANRSLLLLRLSAQQDLDVSELHYVDQTSAFHVIEELLTEKKKIKLSPVQEPRVEKVQEVSSTLKKIQRKLAQISEERGLYECYIGWLFAEGKWKDGTPFRAPLLFFPGKLEIENNQWYFNREERSIQINRSLLLAFSHYHDLKITDALLEEDFEEFPADPLAFRTKIYEWLKASSLEFLFSKDYFTNHLTPVIDYKRQEYEELYTLGAMQIRTHAVLGIFPQAGSTIASDYDAWLEHTPETSLEEFFEERNTLGEDIDPYKEDLMTPFSMDSSQEFAIREVLSGKSIVIQGPPGSGKSETICNMICSAIARGKKVLVVSHKRAALEVVSKRLKQKGMSDFFALVHDVKFDQRSLYTKIDAQIQRLEEYESTNNGLDKIYLEREYANSVRLLTQLNKHSEEFRKALFDTKVCGFSAHELYLRIDTDAGTIDLSDVYTQYASKALEDLLYKVSTYAVYAGISPSHNELWRHRIEMPDLNRQKLSAWMNLSEVYKASIDTLGKSVASFNTVLSYEVAENLQHCVPVLTMLYTFIDKPMAAEIWNAIPDKKQLAFLTKELEQVHVLQETYDSVYKAYSFEALYLVEGILQTAEKKLRNPIAWLLWKMFSSEYATLKEFAAELKIPLTKGNLSMLKQAAETIISAEANLARIANHSTLDILLQEGKALTDIYTQVSFFDTTLSGIATDQSALYAHLLTHAAVDLTSFLSAFIKALQSYKEVLPKAFVYFSAEQHAILIQDTQRLTDWMKFVEQHVDDLFHLDQLLSTLSVTDRICVQRLEQSVHKHTPQIWNVIVQQSVFTLWIYHLELMYPVLRSMNTLSWKQYAQDWEIHSGKRKDLSLEMILGKLREQTYREVVFNRLQNRITYRDLQHQVSKKRLIWPVRKLMHHHAEEIFPLLPCWMMSPEQVSCVFPMEQLFDLIIIDEASQCYTEHSLPAISRAKQVVIAGDSQQLSPSDLYRVRWEDEDEQEADVEIDSLLDLGSRYLAGVMLKGHYRSRYPELISFSNNQFYKNQLNYIPNQQDILSSVKPILYRKVTGVWANHQNDAEAEEVVRITLEKIQSGIHSIGIVCFNFQQAQGIQDLLEAEAINKKIVLPAELFIKNIENVQGDERDIIIFSVGYAPDKNGRFAMQFGSLNMQGGEKRMNVAITRAREQIIIVSSIMPQELRTDNVKHDGPRILKEYLQYAWDCQEYDRTDFFTRNAQAVLAGSTAQKIIDVSKDDTRVHAGILYPFVSLTVQQSGDRTILADTDDSAYLLTEYAKYWHFNKPLLLAQKGWNYKQLFSRMCYSQSKEELIQTIIQ